MRMRYGSPDVCSSHLQRVLERLDHAAIVRDPAKVAAAVLRTGIVRILAREHCEIRAGLARFRRDRGRLFFCGLLRRRIRTWLDLDQDVRSEESRVGKAWVSTCRSRWSTYH